jgi:hypothetical protein
MYEDRIAKPIKNVQKREERKKRVIEGVNLIKVHCIYGNRIMKPIKIIK